MKTKHYNRILLVSESDSPNLGDKLISELVFKLCKDQNLEVVQYPISKGRRYFIVKAIYKISALLRAMSIYDYAVRVMTKICIKNKIDNNTVVIFSGGQMFINYFIDPILAILKHAKKKNAKVIFNACGSGVINDKYKERLKKLLHGCDVSLRDNVDAFKAIYNEAYYRPDIAVATSQILSINNRKSENPTIGWGVINTNTYNFWNKDVNLTDEDYINSASKAISQLTEMGYSVEIFTTGDPFDYVLAEKLYNSIKQSNAVSICDYPTTTNDLIRQIYNFDFVVASRMHALIISYSYNIPYIALKWEQKIIDFARQTQCENRVYDIAKLDEIDWVNSIKDLKSVGLNQEMRKCLINKSIQGVKEVTNTIIN